MGSYYTTSQRAASLEKARASQRAGPQAQRPGRRDEVFIVLFDYSGVVNDEKVRKGGCTMRVVVATQSWLLLAMPGQT